MTDRLDAVVIGGGIAGLTATWRLRHRRVLLLEAGDRLGGRLRSDPLGEGWLNLGAHLFPGPGTVVDGLLRELDLRALPITGSLMGLALDDRVLTSGPVESYVARLPLSASERVAFARAGLRIRRAVARRARAGGPLDFLGDRTFAEFLGDLPPRVAGIFECAAHRATSEPATISAGCGIALFALVWAGKGSLIARNLAGGPARLPEALGRRLGERARVRARAVAIAEHDAGVTVEFEEAGRPRRVQARHAIVAAQAPYAAALLEPLAPAAATALASITYGPFVSMAVETRERAPMPWDGTYAVATPGRAFDLFTNQAHVLRAAGPRRPGGSLMVFAGGRNAAALQGQDDDAVRRAFLADLVTLYPQLRDVVGQTVVQRWPLGNAFAHPGRHRLQPALEGALGVHGRVRLAGDYFAELGTMETAAVTGLAAAARIDDLLAAA